MHECYHVLAASAVILHNISDFTSLTGVQCVGNESRLIDCPTRPQSGESTHCSRYLVAGISCPPISMNYEYIILYEQVKSNVT